MRKTEKDELINRKEAAEILGYETGTFSSMMSNFAFNKKPDPTYTPQRSCHRDIMPLGQALTRYGLATVRVGKRNMYRRKDVEALQQKRIYEVQKRYIIVCFEDEKGDIYFFKQPMVKDLCVKREFTQLGEEESARLLKRVSDIIRKDKLDTLYASYPEAV